MSQRTAAFVAAVSVVAIACKGGSSAGSPPSPPTTTGGAPLIATFTATPSELPRATPTLVTFSWTFQSPPDPAPTCTISGAVQLDQVQSGVQAMVTIVFDDVVWLTCSNAAGSSDKSVILTSPAPEIGWFEATPSSVPSGTPTEVVWSWTYSNFPSPVPSCEIDNGVGPVENGSATIVTIAADTLFTVACSNQFGTSASSTYVYTFVQPPPEPPLLHSVWVAPNPIVESVPTSVLFVWDYANVPYPTPACTVDNGVGPVTESPYDRKTLTLSADTVFTITCTNSVGSDSASVTVYVRPPPAAPVLATFAASPAVVGWDDDALVRWTWTYGNVPEPAPTCSIAPGVGSVSSGDVKWVRLQSDTTYTLTCTNSAGTDTAELILDVYEPPPIVTGFRAFPGWLVGGQASGVTFVWGFENRHIPPVTCTIDGGVGAVSPGDVRNITLSGDTTFTLTCTNSGGTDTASATIVARNPSDVVDLAAGSAHSCALFGGGGAKCWGYSGYGALGNGSTAQAAVSPVTVTDLSSAVALGAGMHHSCAIEGDGSAKCWGDNTYGQLGDGTTTLRPTPVTISGLSAVVAIDGGAGHTCAALGNGGARCWGWNLNGMLGDGTTVDQLAPTAVVNLPPALKLTTTAGHTCALVEGEDAYCWGVNVPDGLLGVDTAYLVSRATPLSVGGLDWHLPPIADVSAGWHHSCALLADGSVQCWGDNTYGQLGDGTTTDSYRGRTVGGLAGVEQLGVGADHACALVTGGSVKCWGRNHHGQLGDGTTSDRSSVVGVPGLTAVRLAVGYDHNCALRSDGTVVCWGFNGTGQLGDGTMTDRTSPVTVLGL